MESWISQLRKGVLELAVLSLVRDHEAYGYQIVEKLRSLPGLESTESTVYPLLARLARDGSLDVRTEPSPAGPPRRYFRLTGTGRRRLEEMARCWQSLHGSLAELLKGVL